jgi:hypothetical protein
MCEFDHAQLEVPCLIQQHRIPHKPPPSTNTTTSLPTSKMVPLRYCGVDSEGNYKFRIWRPIETQPTASALEQFIDLWTSKEKRSGRIIGHTT